MRTRLLIATAVSFVVVGATAGPALAGWFSSSDPAESVHATLRVDDSPEVSRSGWTVTWDVRITCPRGQQITGHALLAERDPVAIPQLAGEDQGITATVELTAAAGERCTGHRQTLRLVLQVHDTTVFDPATGGTLTFHEPLHPTPSTRTTASITLFSPQSPADGGFFVQYCAAPNCASESGPRLTFQ